MRRRLFTLAAAASALLCVAVCVIWVRTYAGPQVNFFVVIRPNLSYGLGTERGAVIGFVQAERPAYRDGDAADAKIYGAGFRYLRITSDGMRRWNLVLPFWLLAPVAAFLPALWFVRRWAVARAIRAGRCRRCAYDLTGNASGVCPECGTALPDGTGTT